MAYPQINPLAMLSSYGVSGYLSGAVSDQGYAQTQAIFANAFANSGALGMLGMPTAQASAAKSKEEKYNPSTTIGDINALMTSKLKDKVKLGELKTVLAEVNDPADRQALIRALGDKGVRNIFDLIQTIDEKGEGYEDVIAYLSKIDVKNGKDNIPMLSAIQNDYDIDTETYTFGKKGAKDSESDSSSSASSSEGSKAEAASEKTEQPKIEKFKSTAEALKDKKVQAKIFDEIKVAYNGLQKDFEASLKDDGWASGAWNSVKETFGMQYSRSNTKEMLDNVGKQLRNVEENITADGLQSLYAEVTGKDLGELSKYDLKKLLSEDKEEVKGVKQNLLTGSKIEEQVKGYEEGQESSSNVAYTVGATAAAAGAILTLPVSGAVALGAGAVAGAAGAVGTYGFDSLGSNREVTLDRTGDVAFGGALTGALGGGQVGVLAAKGYGKLAGKQILTATEKKVAAQMATKETAEEIAKKEAAAQVVTKETAEQTAKESQRLANSVGAEEYLAKKSTEAAQKGSMWNPLNWFKSKPAAPELNTVIGQKLEKGVLSSKETYNAAVSEPYNAVISEPVTAKILMPPVQEPVGFWQKFWKKF